MIEKLIISIMRKSSCYDERFCDLWMCMNCGLSDPNIALECLKCLNVCPRCYGAGAAWYGSYSISYTKLCNQCGGTGKYSHLKTIAQDK